MNKVTRTGSFRGYANDWGVSLTSNSECPQFTMDVVLTEYWDEDNECWVDYTDQEEYIPAYMCMISGAGKVLKNMEQIMKVFSWDGMDFDALAQGDYSDVQFQIRIDDNDPEYADKNPFTVEWLDEYDATPGRGIKKLDSTELKALNKRFAAILKKNAGPAAAKSAPKNPKDKDKPKDEGDDDDAPNNETPKQRTAREKMEANKAASERDEKAKEEKATKSAELKKQKADLAAKKAAAKGDGKKEGGEKKRGMPTFQKPAAVVEDEDDTDGKGNDDDVVMELTQDEAWERIEAAQEQMGDDCTDDMVNDALMAAIKEIGGSDAPDVEAFTKLQWGEVSEVTIKALVGV